MDGISIFFDTGEKLFRNNELIFVNRSYEQPEPHLHAHDFIEIAYVASGCGIHKLGDMEYPVSKGDLFIIKHNVAHEFRSYKDVLQPPLYVYNCVFKPGFIDFSLMNHKNFSDITYHFLFSSFFPAEEVERTDIRLIGSDSYEVDNIYEKMYREYTMQEDGYIEMLRAYVIELLVTVFRLYRKKINFNKGFHLQRKQVIEKVITYINSNYSKEFKLEDLSLMAFLSRNYFCKLFKETTGMTAFEYAQKIRIEEACRLLRETDMKVIDIVEIVGYKDIKFFNQIFKRIMGKTPAELRKSGGN